MKTRTKVLLFLAAASVPIVGCSTVERLLGGGAPDLTPTPGLIRLPDCNGAQCQVEVTFNDTPTSCSVNDPGSLPVKAKQKVLITWHLRSGDFTNDGITFKQGQGTVFTGNNRQQKGVYQVWDDYSNPKNQGKFHYKITIKTDTGHTCWVDPEVVNGQPIP